MTVTYITPEQAAKSDDKVISTQYNMPELSDFAKTAGAKHGLVSIPRESSGGQKISSAFRDAFELIGGVPRLAVWADTHPTDFYKLAARMIPPEMGSSVTHDGQVQIQHILPPGPLDE